MMFRVLALVSVLPLFSVLALAQTASDDHATESDPPSAARREQSSMLIMFHYSHFDLLIPGKYGFSAGYHASADTTYELEYIKADIGVSAKIADIGSVYERRISFNRRSFFGTNSFNLHYGLSYHDFGIHLGDEFFSEISREAYPSLDIIRIQTFGINGGLSNRWIPWKNVSLGVDWFSWSQPLVIVDESSVFLDKSSNAAQKDRIRTAQRIIAYFPRLSVLKLTVGMVF